MARIGSYLFPLLGAAFAVAGADKIIGNRGYASMFRHLGWSHGDGELALPRSMLLVAAVAAVVAER